MSTDFRGTADEDIRYIADELGLMLPNLVAIHPASDEFDPVLLTSLPVGTHFLRQAYDAGCVIHARIGAGDEPKKAKHAELDLLMEAFTGGTPQAFVGWAAFVDLMAFGLEVYEHTDCHVLTLRHIAGAVADFAVVRCQQRSEEWA